MLSENNTIMATVESARLGRRNEESARFFATISFPIKGNEQLMLLVGTNIKNPIELGFGVIQASLPETFASSPAPETETVDMTVDGQPAKVTRPRRQRNGAAPEPEPAVEARPWDEGEKPLPHSFKAHGKDNQCAWCYLGEDNELHVQDEMLPDAAQALIDQAREDDEAARREPANEEEAREQAEAEAALAARSE